MANEVKKWSVEYSHSDGRSGKVNAVTEIQQTARARSAFEYGNGLCGLLAVGDFKQGYDLRYCLADDLHMVMLEDYFGAGLVRATEA